MSPLQLPDRINLVFPHRLWEQVPTIVAVSGGADSVALLRGMLEVAKQSGSAKPNLIVGHVNHGIRGDESDTDAKFVEGLAKRHGLEFKLGNFDDSRINSSIEGVGTSEESLRDFRYEKLISMSAETGARYIAMAHNLDDQVETILFRLFRGTSIPGLSGIPSMRLGNDSVTIVRPLLSIDRVEIEAYLNTINQDYRQDSSNSNSSYTRNYLRNELIPELKKRFGESLPSSVTRLGQHAFEVNEYLDAQSQPLWESIINRSNESVKLDCLKLQNFPELLVRHFLSSLWIKQNWPRQSMTSRWWIMLSRQIQNEPSDPTVLNLPGNLRFERSGNSAEIAKNVSS